MSLQVSDIPERNLIIDFEISKIKNAIKEITSVNVDNGISLISSNDIFGTYVIKLKQDANYGFALGELYVTLNKINDNKTQIKVDVNNVSFGNSSSVVTSQMLGSLQEKFLDMLAKVLSGQVLNKQSMLIENEQTPIFLKVFMLIILVILIIALISISN